MASANYPRLQKTARHEIFPELSADLSRSCRRATPTSQCELVQKPALTQGFDRDTGRDVRKAQLTLVAERSDAKILPELLRYAILIASALVRLKLASREFYPPRGCASPLHATAISRHQRRQVEAIRIFRNRPFVVLRSDSELPSRSVEGFGPTGVLPPRKIGGPIRQPPALSGNSVSRLTPRYPPRTVSMAPTMILRTEASIAVLNIATE